MRAKTVVEDTTFTWTRHPVVLTVESPVSPTVHYEVQVQGDTLAITTSTRGSFYTMAAPLKAPAEPWSARAAEIVETVEGLAYACAGVERPS